MYHSVASNADEDTAGWSEDAAHSRMQGFCRKLEFSLYHCSQENNCSGDIC